MAREPTEKQESKPFAIDPFVAKTLAPLVREAGLRTCGVCNHARDPKTGKCSAFPEHGGDPYTPRVRNDD